MANKITNLRNWINGEVFNARDYTYERNLIVSLVNNHEDRVTTLEINNTANAANIAANTANIAANTANIATNTSKITVLEDFANNLDDTYLDKTTTSLQTIQGPITFNSKVILNETNLDETFLDKVTTDEQIVAGPVTFISEVILNGTNLDSELESLDVRITDLEEIVENRRGSELYTDLDEPTDPLTGDIWFDSGG
jgi:hypothetical protein